MIVRAEKLAASERSVSTELDEPSATSFAGVAMDAKVRFGVPERRNDVELTESGMKEIVGVKYRSLEFVARNKL